MFELENNLKENFILLINSEHTLLKESILTMWIPIVLARTLPLGPSLVFLSDWISTLQ